MYFANALADEIIRRECKPHTVLYDGHSYTVYGNVTDSAGTVIGSMESDTADEYVYAVDTDDNAIESQHLNHFRSNDDMRYWCVAVLVAHIIG